VREVRRLGNKRFGTETQPNRPRGQEISAVTSSGSKDSGFVSSIINNSKKKVNIDIV